MNIVLQLAGITLLLFLIFDHLSYYKSNKKYEKNYFKRTNFIGFIGNIDLILGILLAIRSIYGIIPLGLLSFLAIILLLKALMFVWGGDVASMLDILSAIIIISLSMAVIPPFIIIGIAIYLIQKGILSLFS